MEKQKSKEKKDKVVKSLVAKKDHVIFQNGEKYEIKKGDEIKVPERFLEVLKTEKVI